jgi:putative transcriptional regulator
MAQSGELSNDDIRFFLGYSGWSPGQLENEIEEEAWIVASSGGGVLFEEAADELWRAVLRRLGGEYALLSTFPDDPRMN